MIRHEAQVLMRSRVGRSSRRGTAVDWPVSPTTLNLNCILIASYRPDSRASPLSIILVKRDAGCTVPVEKREGRAIAIKRDASTTSVSIQVKRRVKIPRQRRRRPDWCSKDGLVQIINHQYGHYVISRHHIGISYSSIVSIH